MSVLRGFLPIFGHRGVRLYSVFTQSTVLALNHIAEWKGTIDELKGERGSNASPADFLEPYE